MLTRYQYEKIISVLELPENKELYAELKDLTFEGLVLNDAHKDLIVAAAASIFEVVEASEKFQAPEGHDSVEFLVAFLASNLRLELNEKTRTALGIHPAPTAWHKPNPPTKYVALSMSSTWQEEASKVSGIASKISFLALSNDNAFRGAVFEALGIGGYIDSFDPASIPLTDLTMQCFIEGARCNLTIAQPLWHEINGPNAGQPLCQLPQGVDGRSAEAIAAEVDWSRYISRRDAQRAARATAKAAEIAKIEQARAFAFARFEPLPGWKDLVGSIVVDFEAAKSTMASPTVAVRGTPRPTWFKGEFLDAVLKLEDTTATADLIDGTIIFAEQFLRAKASNSQPTWFKKLDDGEFRLRKAPLAVRNGFDRKTRSVHIGLLNLIAKCGFEAVDKHFAWLKTQDLKTILADHKRDSDADAADADATKTAAAGAA